MGHTEITYCNVDKLFYIRHNKGFAESLEYCRNYIKHNAGTDFSYFEDYKNGTVSIYCNETGETVEVYSCEDGSLLESNNN